MNLQQQQKYVPWWNKQPMIEALDDEPLFHSVMWAWRDIILQSLPRLGNGFVYELLKLEILFRSALVLPNRRTWGEMHWTQLPCWCRATALPSPIMRMENGRDVPYHGSFLGW
jgi:hypothetical protein